MGDWVGMGREHLILAIHHDNDPSAALIRAGRVLAYSEEERHVRIKHAHGYFPGNAIASCLRLVGASVADIDYLAINWDIGAFTDGRIVSFYQDLRTTYPELDAATLRWQMRNVANRNLPNYTNYVKRNWYSFFGTLNLPELHYYPHHYTHAFHAFGQSPFDECLCLTMDGSGDTECTVLWRCEGYDITPLKTFRMPHSLGWFYGAITEYLGFQSRDGEYKVMGMASYGEPSEDIFDKLSQVIIISHEDGSYIVDPSFIHHGGHTYSDRFTDKLVDLLGRRPRSPNQQLESWHYDVAFAAQSLLEEAALSVVRWGVNSTGISKLCISGGVGLNVKLNSRLHKQPYITAAFAHPLCGDNGAVCGAGLLASMKVDGTPPEKLKTLSLGHYETSQTVEHLLCELKMSFERVNFADLPMRVASEIASGKIVGWFQGRMEAGPRALGNRSILADPRTASRRDRVNLIIKHREDWRPLCPSVLKTSMSKYFTGSTRANSEFMIMAFDANERMKREAPGVVHIDGTARVQSVSQEANPLYYNLIKAFGEITGVDALLNTSFNLAGEPIVCTALDAVRTFCSSGLDLLVIEDFLLQKKASH